MATYQGVTIDASHSQDLDDAIWVERVDGQWRLTVSVALVAERVAAGSIGDRGAFGRAFSRYRPGGVTDYMLSRDLTERMLSLTPGNPSRVIATTLTFDDGFNLVDFSMGTGDFVHRGRLNHEEAGSRVGDRSNEVSVMLTLLWELAVGLLEVRRSGGALVYFSTRSGVYSNEEGRLVTGATSQAVSRGNIMVAEAMVAANGAVAEHFARKGVHLVYRNHSGNPVADRTALQRDLELAVDGGDQSLPAIKRLDFMIGKATLSEKATGHFALNLPVYAWFTSPMRRYADLVNQRIAVAASEGLPSPYSERELGEIAKSLNAAYDADGVGQAAHMKALAGRAAHRQLSSGTLEALTSTEMTAVLKAAVERNEYPEEFLDELIARFAAGRLTSKDVGRMLISGETALVRAALDGLVDRPHDAVSVLNYLKSRDEFTAAEWEEGVRGVQAHAVVSVEFNGRPMRAEGAAPQKKEAAQRAAVRLLGRCVLPSWEPPAEWAVPPPDPDGSARPETVDDRAKGELIAFCRANGYSAPEFAVERSGPPHKPTFSAVASVKVAGMDEASRPMAAGSRKDAEKLAASRLLARLQGKEAKPRDETRVVAATPSIAVETAKNRLQEFCQKRGWHVPAYDNDQSGPPHAPTFTSVATVVIGGKALASKKLAGPSRKDAEKMAAADLLAKLIEARFT